MSASAEEDVTTVVEDDVPVDAVARPAALIPESCPLPEAWARLHHDPARAGVVVRDGLPIAVVTAGGLAERWPAGGPLVQYRWTVHDALDRPCGVEVLAAEDTFTYAGRRLLATGLPALPVRRRTVDDPLRILTTTDVLRALLGEWGP
ncbi:hypothetical protein Acsp06_58520 [Actinomycetospora sp. NBRC 106375]|uniref:hypothetical protein n=1 Tax=Actinomycetospora sp. NBRC 106375 TaxID=3032207 RepID=UPI0024A38D06|nr:hypothetical protein [Actinomycetospora sp. NBRC 106375]GLZ49667.1 hypothetical protein Acsp06_58520 [Actinomycetospora sp. NBRC 106375]